MKGKYVLVMGLLLALNYLWVVQVKVHKKMHGMAEERAGREGENEQDQCLEECCSSCIQNVVGGLVGMGRLLMFLHKTWKNNRIKSG